jgi:hypothetical protein
MGAWLPLRTLTFLGSYILIACLILDLGIRHNDLGNGYSLASEHDHTFIWKSEKDIKLDHILCIYSRGRLVTGRLLNGKIFVFDTQTGDLKVIDVTQSFDPHNAR